MGIPGARKSSVAEAYVARGYVRLNRDERGGTLRDIAAALDEQLSSGARRLVLDNTYLTRASRSYVIEVAGRHGVAARCIWLDTPLAQAQVNLVDRLLERFGSLPAPEELQKLAKREPGVLAPTSQMRAFRELEPPDADEGFASVDRLAFERAAVDGQSGVFVAATALATTDWAAETDPAAPHLVFDWRPDGASPIEIPRSITGPAEIAVCSTWEARRSAGAGRRFRGCRSRSRGRRRRSCAFDPRRHKPRPQDAGDDARRPLRRRLTRDRLELVHDIG